GRRVVARARTAARRGAGSGNRVQSGPQHPGLTSSMSADSRTRRSTRPEDRVPPACSGTETVPRPIVSLLAQASRITDILPHLHQQAVDATRGICSLLLEHNARRGMLAATSGYGLESVSTEPLVAESGERALVGQAFDTRTPILVTNTERQTPELAARLGTRTALLVPLARGEERIGLLVIGF